MTRSSCAEDAASARALAGKAPACSGTPVRTRRNAGCADGASRARGVRVFGTRRVRAGAMPAGRCRAAGQRRGAARAGGRRCLPGGADGAGDEHGVLRGRPVRRLPRPARRARNPIQSDPRRSTSVLRPRRRTVRTAPDGLRPRTRWPSRAACAVPGVACRVGGGRTRAGAPCRVARVESRVVCPVSCPPCCGPHVVCPPSCVPCGGGRTRGRRCAAAAGGSSRPPRTRSSTCGACASHVVHATCVRVCVRT